MTARPLRVRLQALLRRRSSVAGAVVLLTAVSVLSVPRGKFDGRIDVMLPDDSGLRSLFTFLREIQVADKILVTLARRDGAADPGALAAAADRYLADLDPALAAPLNTRFQADALTGDFSRLARQLPDYLAPETLAADLTEPGIRRVLGELQRRIQRPEGLFAAAGARADPLDWNGRLVRQILAAVAAFGYRAIPVGAHLMDTGQRHLLLVLQTPVSMMDSGGVRRLLRHLDERARALPPNVEARLVCGHMHTAGNEAVIRRDIRITGTAVTIVFLVLFLGIYRDWRSIGITLIPAMASAPALAIASHCFDRFSYLVLGFGCVIVGIADDYGIHTYVLSRGARAAEKLRRVRLPMTLSALTTACVFIAFCFSSLPAYRQLGLFATIAVLLSLFYAFWVLPPFVRPAVPVNGAHRLRPPAEEPRLTRRCAWLVLLLALAACAAGAVLVARLEMDADVTRLDGTPRETLDEERRALAIWGGGESLAAVLCVEAGDEAAALRLNDRLHAGLLAEGLAPASVSSLAPIRPSDETRRARRARWAAFWTDARAGEFRAALERAAGPMGFADGAFQPFWELFDAWRRTPPDEAPEPIRFLEPLGERFIHAADGRVRVVTFIPDDTEHLAAARRVRQSMPGLRIVSRTAFAAELSEAVGHEVVRISLLAAAMILVVTVAVIRRVGMVLLAGVPALFGLLWGGAAMKLCGLPLNISNMIAGIIVLGLCIDYGICTVYAHQRHMRRDMALAMTLSALTTVLGAAVLLLARHPAFFSIGVMLVSGITAGYLFAWLVLPAAQTVWPRLNPPLPGGGDDLEEERP